MRQTVTVNTKTAIAIARSADLEVKPRHGLYISHLAKSQLATPLDVDWSHTINWSRAADFND